MAENGTSNHGTPQRTNGGRAVDREGTTIFENKTVNFLQNLHSQSKVIYFTK